MTAQPWDYWSAMVRAAAPVVGPDDAHDCAAEALTQFLERHPDEVGNLEALLVTITKRRAVDHVRLRIRERRRNALLAHHDELEAPDVAEEIVTRAEAGWVDAQARRLLSPQAYELLLLVADGLTMHEVATRLGVSERTAFSRLAEARRLVREALSQALVVLGLGVAAVRRWLTPATASTAVVAAAFVLSLASSPPPVTEPDLLVEPETSPWREDPAPGRAMRVVIPAAHVVRAPIGPVVRPGETSVQRVAGVQTPVAGARVERRDDGQHSSGPVEQLQQCVENLRVDLHYLGCEQQSHR